MIDSRLAQGLERLRQQDAAIDTILDGRVGEVLALLQKYIEEIELFNPAYSLVKVRDREELVVKHILDSLSPLGILGARGPMADVGSGAGLPGIPLAIALPELPITLIERMGRRAGFLRNTTAVLGLSNVTVEEVELERAAGNRFDRVVFRAFRPLEPAILGALFRLLIPGGYLAAYKGRRSAIEEELGKLPESLHGGWEAVPCPVPFLAEERHLALLRSQVHSLGRTG